jgi:hypothetical protein
MARRGCTAIGAQGCKHPDAFFSLTESCRGVSTHTVEIVRKPRKSGSTDAFATDRFSTLAMCGPDRQASTIASTTVTFPENTTSTEPSRRLRTQPYRFRAIASLSAQARYPTPWTRPVTMTRTVLIMSLSPKPAN